MQRSRTNLAVSAPGPNRFQLGCDNVSPFAHLVLLASVIRWPMKLFFRYPGRTGLERLVEKKKG